jgi:Tfp pilus assembly protein PilO
MNKQQDYTLEQIIEQSFDFSGYKEDEKIKFISEISSMVMEASLLKALEDAGEEMQDKFNDLLEKEPSEEEMADFIKVNFPSFGDIVVDEIKEFQRLSSEKQQKTD